MTASKSDTLFAGSIPQLYERYLVPLIFEPYAVDLAVRVASQSPSRVLEVAAGTGVVTRRLAATLPRSATIVATDLNRAMLDQAAAVGTARSVEWKQADATSLPFADASFDAVVCQFGAMFFPDKPKAFAEAKRVLRDGGSLIFNVWDRIEDNEFADVVTDVLAAMFPKDPPQFMARTPHGYHDADAVTHDVMRAGFARPRIDTVTARSPAPNALFAAIAYCQGTPLRSEIESRGGSLEEATRVSARALESRFGSGAVDGKIQAHVVTAER